MPCLSDHSPQIILATKVFQEHLSEWISKQMLRLFTEDENELKEHFKNGIHLFKELYESAQMFSG